MAAAAAGSTLNSAHITNEEQKLASGKGEVFTQNSKKN